MKSICIKTNNENQLNYLLNELEYIEIKPVIISTNKFKNYKNIIIHYKGNDIKKFIHEVSCILSCLVIDELEENDDIVKKHKLEDLYKKLNYMKEILDTCDGNYTAAAKQISSGNTILGKVKISRQGLIKDLKYFENVKKEYEQYCKEKEKRNKKEETR